VACHRHRAHDEDHAVTQQDRRGGPPREEIADHERDEARRDREPVRDGVEHRAERRDLTRAARDRPVDPVGRDDEREQDDPPRRRVPVDDQDDEDGDQRDADERDQVRNREHA
jgi:hypothetical protein